MLSLFHVGHNYWHPIIATSFSQHNSSEFSPIMPEDFGVWKIQTRPIIRFLTEAVRFWFFICWYLIESMMPCIWTRCSGPPAEKQAHNIKDPAVYLTVDMGYFFIPVCTKLIWWVCCQKALFSVSSDHRSQCHLKFKSCLITEFAGVCFWMSEDNFSWNPPEQHVVI